MAQGYGQYCPLALAVELLGERWTMLVVSRLLDGCRRFSEIQRGVPKMSATLLTKRLRQLQDAGLCEKRPGNNGVSEYLPTQACQELDPIVMGLAAWGQRWARDMESEDLDPGFLAWSMSTRLDTANMPAGRTVIEFEFSGYDEAFKRFWLVNNDGVVEMCLKHPGYETDIKVMADVQLFVYAWRGLRSLRADIEAGQIRLEGAGVLCNQLPDWLLGSALATQPRCRPGAEFEAYQKFTTVARLKN